MRKARDTRSGWSCPFTRRGRICNSPGVISVILFLWILSKGVSVVYAQRAVSSEAKKKALWKADYLRDNHAYNMALSAYRSLYRDDKNNPVVQLRLAETYRLLDKPKEAITWYRLAVEDTVVAKPIHRFHYAQELCKDKKYILAKRHFDSYERDMLARYKYSEKGVDSANLPFLLPSSSSASVVDRLTINSLGADFSPFFFKNGLVYVSTRGKDLTINALRKHHTEESAYFDLYFSEFDGKKFSKPVKFHNNVNSNLHEGPLVIFNNSRRMIFTRNYTGRGSKQVNKLHHFGKLRLYSMSLSEEGEPDWDHPKMLPFSDYGISYGHPATDGKVLYFVSDMYEGAGKTDIYKSTFKGDKWGNPQNVGPSINSEEYELFPYLAPDGMLYFASDKPGGLGGLDIYRIDPRSDSGKAVNLGYPLNTHMDDFGIILDDASGRSGYICSNRTRGGHDDDIYRFYPLEEDSLYRVADSLSTILVAADYVSTPDGNIIGMSIPYQKMHNETTEWQPTTINAEHLDKNTPEPPDKDKKIAAPPDKPNKPDRPDKPDKNTSGQPSRGIDGPDIVVMVGKRPNVQIFQGKDGKLIAYNGKQAPVGANNQRIWPVYFEFGKSFLDAVGIEELRKVANLMKAYPHILLEVNAHADSRGGEASNQALSVRRANSAISHLVTLGVDKRRITSKPHGELMPINECDDLHPCDEAHHRLNRRIDFKIIPDR